MRTSSPNVIDGQRRPVPLRALLLSVASLGVPALAAFALPGWTEEQGALVWLTALVPAFLLAYYRGMKGVALALAGGMAVLSITQVVVLLLGVGEPNWALLLAVVVLYLGISIGLGVFAELLHRERRAAEELALLDGLTGLPNRRHAELILEGEIAAALRGRVLSVVLFDLDQLERINETHGRDAGDRTLKDFAAILESTTRLMNLSSRFGGEEFLSVLADANLEEAAGFADRVRDGLNLAEFPWGNITVSAGVAAYQRGMGSYEVLIASADRAVCAAKEAGGDRVVLAREFPGEQRKISQPGSLRPRGAVAGSSGAAKILVVDDDRDVRRSLVRVLNQAGYDATETDEPAEAIQRCTTPDGRMDLLITNVLMPKMNGLTLVDRILKRTPEVPVVFVAGNVQSGVSWAGLPGSVVGVLEKPIGRDRLLATVDQVLREALPSER